MTSIPTCLVALGALTAVSAPTLAAAAEPLAAFRWKARPVVVFARAPGDAVLRKQLRRLISERTALEDREMPVLVVYAASVTTLEGARDPVLDACRLRAAFGVAENDFAIVLVGKDGGEKLRATEPVSASRLIALVDAMPMRRRETR